MNQIMDTELAAEMVKLLGQELKITRAQLREAKRRTSTPHTVGHSNGSTHEREQELLVENEALKADHTVLQEVIARLQEELTQVSSIKSEDQIHNSWQYTEPSSHMRAEITRLRAENEDIIREKEEASRNQEKLLVLQEKYRRSKDKVHEYNETLNELRVALSNCVEELEQSRKAAVSEIDFRGFLKDLSYEPVQGQPEFSSIQSYSRGIHVELHKDAVGVCKGLYFVNSNEVIWSPSGIALGLVIKPIFQYNPKTHGGAWTKLEDNFAVDKRMDLCYSSGKTSRYLGTYERVADQGTMIIAPETLKFIGHEKLDYASKCTTLFPDLVPPSQTQMIKNMYKQGVIKLQCFVIRCVAVNHTFTEKLRCACTSSVQSHSSDNTVIPTPDVRKRKRKLKSTVYSSKNKKRCVDCRVHLDKSFVNVFQMSRKH